MTRELGIHESDKQATGYLLKKGHILVELCECEDVRFYSNQIK